MKRLTDSTKKHEHRVWCAKWDAIVRNYHHADSTGACAWAHKPCEGPHHVLYVGEVAS